MSIPSMAKVSNGSRADMSDHSLIQVIVRAPFSIEWVLIYTAGCILHAVLDDTGLFATIEHSVG